MKIEAVLLATAAMAVTAADSAPAATFNVVKQRGSLACGVHGSRAGFFTT